MEHVRMKELPRANVQEDAANCTEHATGSKRGATAPSALAAAKLPTCLQRWSSCAHTTRCSCRCSVGTRSRHTWQSDTMRGVCPGLLPGGTCTVSCRLRPGCRARGRPSVSTSADIDRRPGLGCSRGKCSKPLPASMAPSCKDGISINDTSKEQRSNAGGQDPATKAAARAKQCNPSILSTHTCPS